jgi:hypothetical protein
MERKSLMQKVYEIRTETNRRHMRDGSSRLFRGTSTADSGDDTTRLIRSLERYTDTSAHSPDHDN